MTAWEECTADVDQGACSIAPRAEELFNNLANEEVVSSESAGLVVALAYLDLQVTEEQEPTREILQPAGGRGESGEVFGDGKRSYCLRLYA